VRLSVRLDRLRNSKTVLPNFIKFLCMLSVAVARSSSDGQGVSTVISYVCCLCAFVCLSVCLSVLVKENGLSYRKVGTHILHGRPSARTDPEVKRSSSAPPAWVRRSIRHFSLISYCSEEKTYPTREFVVQQSEWKCYSAWSEGDIHGVQNGEKEL